MDLDSLTGATAQGMLLCLYCSLPVVIVAALAGLAVSFIQAITSMQDQTLPHGVKLIAVVVTIIIAGPFAAAAVLHFANQMMRTALPI
ncbi:type III secretion system export apparatus subunit SctS [Paraburkholderia acidisoli]|uniref:EscS/YscS/HrcS family type III secretion system export apparatus protein n=1 Tax=Paraburkholderia acidisoli TaxID=2571748 RepID=A0A7Z2JHJ6_9BURK|nr:type III secretion system export apparatus subunit SctS [Paraburkholderia acidisoli]QGZ65827.1 EscS/YscS/HrcS family type III secretion system export apparatus protein [Paraburkholderia acidisoli]